MEDETIEDFNARLCDIINEIYALGKRIPEERLVSKTLRALLSHFYAKITATE